MPRRNLWSKIALALPLLFTVACSGDDYTYSSYHCNLVIDNATHNNATLASAMNSMSPGVFCKISYDNSKKTYVFTNNQGQSSPSNPLSQNELTRLANGSRVGLNNGLIVGYGNLSSTDTGGYVFYAFDAECPNCFDFNAIPLRSYPLTMTTAGIAECANCKRQYNMNTGGNCINNTGKGLTTYRAASSGALGTLTVN
jgi:hypothetical protein